MEFPIRSRVRALLVLSLLAAGACTRAASTDAEPPSGGVRRSANVITSAEIAEVHVATAYQAVEHLRPVYLRGLRSNIQPVVYVNGLRWGGLESLRRIRADDVETIRRLTASEAHTQYGPGLLGGVLDVVTRNGRGP